MIDLSLQPQHLQVEAGGTLLATISLRNPALTPTTFQIEIQGLDAAWYTLSAVALTVDEGADAQAILTIHPPANAAGSHEFTVLATPSTQAIGKARVEATLSISAMPTTRVVPAAVAMTRIGDARARMIALPRNSLVIGAAVLLFLAAISTFALMKGRNDASTTKPCATISTESGSRCAGKVARAQHVDPHPSHPVVTGTAPSGTFTALILSPTPVLTTEPGLSGSPKHPRRSTPPATLRPVPTASAIAPDTYTASPSVTPVGTVPMTTVLVASSTASPIGASATAAASATSSDTSTATLVPTSTATSSSTMAGTATSTVTHTPAPTDTPANTATPANTDTPSATGTATATDTVTQTPLPSPTPIEIAVRYGYDVNPHTFILKWQTVNAASFAVDGLTGPPNGMRRYPLRNHTFVLTATSRDGAQTKIAVVTLAVVNSCLIRVNGQRADISGPNCRNGEPIVSPTPALLPSATRSPLATRGVTAIPTARRATATRTPEPNGAGAPPSTTPTAATPTAAVVQRATSTPGIRTIPTRTAVSPAATGTALSQADTPVVAISTPTP